MAYPLGCVKTASLFPPANSAEPALTASEYFGGKTARPKVVDLETREVSAPSAPIPSPVTAELSRSEMPKMEPVKSKSTPTPFITPAVSKLAESTKIESLTAEEPEIPAKNLEIEQEESEDDFEAAPKSENLQSSPKVLGTASGSMSEPAKPNGTELNAVCHLTEKSAELTFFQSSDHLLVKRLSDKATVPTRGSALAAGYDLYAAEENMVPARGKALIDLQLSIAVPEGTYGRVAPRSGLGTSINLSRTYAEAK